MTVEKEKYARNGIHMGMNGGFVLLSALGDAGKFPFLISIEVWFMLDLISELKSPLFHGIKTKDIRHIVRENSLRFFTGRSKV